MKTRLIIGIFLLTLLSLNLFSQEKPRRFGIELNGGASFAVSNPLETNLMPGFGFEGILQYDFLQHLGVYGGWGWNHFASEGSSTEDGPDYEETGYVLGLQFRYPFGSSPVSFFVRGGALYNHIEVENSDGDIILDTGHGFGWQATGGVDIPLGSNWSLTPGIKFNSLSREVDVEGVSDDLIHNYLSVRVGIVKRF